MSTEHRGRNKKKEGENVMDLEAKATNWKKLGKRRKNITAHIFLK